MFTQSLKLSGIAATVVIGATTMAHAWTLDNGASKLAFGSIKAESVGEVHTFTQLSGSVSDKGAVTVDIDLASLQTNVDIRNERMAEHVFKGFATANLSTSIDMEKLDAMKVGETSVMDVEGKLSFLGTDVDVETSMFVARLSKDQVLVTTNDMIFVGTDDIGIEAGVDKLMELAGLPSITRASPVVLRFVFNNDAKES